MAGANAILRKNESPAGPSVWRVLKRVWGLILLTGICLMTPGQTNAYVLQGAHLLNLMIHAMATAQSLRVVQNVIVEDSAIADHPLEISETLCSSLPGSFRSESRYQDTTRIHVVSHSEAITILDGKRISDQGARFDRYAELLLYRTRSLLHKILLTHGVDVGKTSLGRNGDQIVYVIGAQYPDETVSQVWVDKERFLPLRWIDISTSDPRDRLEFVYLDWRQKDDLWYPMRVEIYRDHVLIRRISVAMVEVNPSLSSELFDIPHLINIYPAASESPETGKSKSTDEVNRAIKEFQKKFDE